MTDRAAPKNLDEAMLIVQANRPKVVKTSIAEVETKGGGYAYTFADLAAVADAVLPMLSDLGVLWQTWIDTLLETGQAPRRVLHWRLCHVASQTEKSGVWPLVGDTPQAVGGAVTYGRRHCLVTATGLTPQDDDDAMAAEAERAAEFAAGRGTARRAQTDRRRPAPTGGTAQRAQRPAAARPPLPADVAQHRDAATGPALVTVPQLQKLVVSLNEAGIGDRGEKLEIVQLFTGRPMESSKEMTMAEARVVIDAIDRALTNPDPAGALWQAAAAAQADRDQHTGQQEYPLNDDGDRGPDGD